VVRPELPRSVVTDRWIAIDFETANRERASACALGAAVIEGGRVVATHSWLIDPAADFDWFNSQLHGIDADTVGQSPEFDEVWDEFSPLLDGASLLAHNATFDMGVLGASLERYELPRPQVAYLCTVTLARRAMPHLGNHKLDTVSSACGIGLCHHDAGSDAEACARIALACCDVAGAHSVTQLAEVLGVRARTL